MALVLVAVLGAQPVELRFGLDALGHRLDAQHPAHRDHQPRQRTDPVAACDEGAVDLQRADRAALQIGEVGVAGAEVVDRQPEAHVGELVQRPVGGLVLAEHHRLGDLQLDLLRVAAGVAHDARDGVDQAWIAELARRQVHRDAQPPSQRLPQHLLARGLLQHHRADRADQAGLLAQADEHIRRDQAAARMAPAHQRLGAHQTAAADLHPRLVVHLELVALDGHPQILLELDALAGQTHQLRGEPAHAVAAGLLGAVERQVGIAQQRVDVMAVAREAADAHRGRDLHLQPTDHHGAAQLGLQPAHQLAGAPLDVAVAVRHQHQELVAAQPCDQVVGVQRGIQALRDLHQQPVADVMAERVVDRLEAVQVDEDQRRLAAAGVQAVEALLEVARDEAAVGQAGEGVAHRQPVRARLGLLELGDVDLADQEDLAALDRIAAQPHRDVVPARPQAGADLRGGAGLAAAVQLLDDLAQLAPVEHPAARAGIRMIDSGARGRIAVERPAAHAVERDHDGRVHHRLGTAQRDRVGHRFADGLAQHAHAAVVQHPAGADDVDGARHAARIERPQLGAAAVMQQEVLLQLAQPLRDGRRHLLRHVALAQLLEAVAAPQAQRGLVGPEHAALVDVVEPDRRAQPLQRRDMGAGVGCRWTVTRGIPVLTVCGQCVKAEILLSGKECRFHADDLPKWRDKLPGKLRQHNGDRLQMQKNATVISSACRGQATRRTARPEPGRAVMCHRVAAGPRVLSASSARRGSRAAAPRLRASVPAGRAAPAARPSSGGSCP